MIFRCFLVCCPGIVCASSNCLFKCLTGSMGLFGAGFTGMARFFAVRKFLRKLGFEKDDIYFVKQMGKAMLCTYTLFGLAWLYNETSPLGWFNIQIRPKEEKEMAHLYERRLYPYPGDTEAVEEFIRSGKSLGTLFGPKGIIETDKDSDNLQKQLQNKKFDQEAQKLWFRMRNEVIQELQEKGFDVE